MSAVPSRRRMTQGPADTADPVVPATQHVPDGARHRALDRLSRFENGGFVPVGEGDIAHPYVHVFVHGWQPGFRVQERLLATADGVPALHAWDPRLVDARGRTLISDYLALLEALEELGPDHAVLWYSWLDESATDPDIFLAYRSRQATQVNGRRLALALQRAMAASPRVHLIGHSHGSAVVTHAALALERRPDHLTLLDAPEDPLSRAGGASDLIDVVLPRLRPGRAGGRTFVDSYASAFGRPYHRRPGLSSVVDVQLTAPLAFTRDPVRAISAVHLYPLDWYARSVRDSHRGVGYGWSPLDGRVPTELNPWYVSPLPNRPLDLRRRFDIPGQASRMTRKPAIVHRTPVADVCLELTSAAPVAAGIITSQPGDQLVEFEIDALHCNGSERLDVEVDGVPAFVSEADFPVPASGRYVLLADGRPGDHLFTARLTGASGDAALTVSGLRLVNRPHTSLGPSITYRPERTAAAIFGVGAVSGGVATLLTLLATGWTARSVLAAVRRRRSSARP